MNPASHPLFFATIFTVLSSFTDVVSAVDFKRDIQPILKEHCYKCHSGPRAKRKIRYDNARYLAELVGTHSEAIIVPGKPESSKMYVLSSKAPDDTDAMPPPRRGKPLNSAQKALIRKWIAEGASFEDQPESEPVPATTTENMEKDKIHEWTNQQGNSLKAAFVSSDGTRVKLRREDGTEIEYPLNKLSPQSQELVKFLSN